MNTFHAIPRPSIELVSSATATYAERYGFPNDTADVAAYAPVISQLVAQLGRLEQIPAPDVRTECGHRLDGRRPSAREDPFNSIIWLCDVEGASDGPLAGTRMGVKDNIAVAGIPMTNGGVRLPVVTPTEDAVVIERLLRAGASIVAKTNMADMSAGMGETSRYGATLNPHDPSYVAGGSSSGSGAAVAAGLVDAALGTDQAGSLRIPAAWCGLVGMKATHGLVPSYGMTYLDHTMDHIGPMTANVADNARVLEMIAGSDWRDPQWVRADPVATSYRAAASQGVRGLRIGVIAESLEPAGCTADALVAFETATTALRRASVDVSSISVPLWREAGTISAGILCYAVASMVHSFGQGFGHRGRVDVNLMEMLTAQLRQSGADFPLVWRSIVLAVDHLRDTRGGIHFGLAQNLRLELTRQIDDALARCDLLVTPTTPGGPVRLSEVSAVHDGATSGSTSGAEAATRNTCALNLSGHPALTLPAGVTGDGLPLGIQLIGRRFDEWTVYRVAFALENDLD